MKTLVCRAIPVALAAAFAAAGCSLQEQEAPSLVGPSEQALATTVTATPDTLARDGASTSLITVSVRDVEGRPVPAQRFRMTASSGTLSVTEVVTGSEGRATLTFTAPSSNQNVSEATVVATTVGTDSRTSSSRSVRISLFGPQVPVPAFTWAPLAPAQFELVTFDGSQSTLGGAACPSCTYAWNFDGEGALTGNPTQYRFQNQRLYRVTLTVTAPGGTAASVTQSVSVGASVAPTAAFTFSPTNPRVGETVYFNGSGSRGANGATISRYLWNFGNGAEATSSSPTATATYASARTYTVTLIVEDNNGKQSTPATQTVTVAAP
jgi:hypothetical protein